MSDPNRREHFRVQITVPVKWKILTENEIEIFKKGLGNTLLKQSGIPSPIESFLEETATGSKDEQLFQALQFLNNKLDFIIEQLLSRDSFGKVGHDNIIEISASGLTFVSKEKFEKNTLMKMELIIPGVVHYNMELIAEILRSTKKEDQYVYATRIVYINDDERDSIVKLVFKKQRMDIRNKKNQEDID